MSVLFIVTQILYNCIVVSLSGQQGIIQQGSSKSKLTVVTWNIFRGTRIGDIVRFLRQADADIVALQEVSHTTYAGVTANAANVLARELDMNAHYCRTMINEKHDPPYELGNAILCKYPFTITSCIPVNPSAHYDGTPDSEPRIICEALTMVRNVGVRILSTHLYHPHQPPVNETARAQFDAVASVLDDRPTLLMGDFNTELDSELFRDILNKLSPAGKNSRAPTFTNIKYDPDETRIFDHILTSSHFKVLRYAVADEDASDHMPVLCTLEMRDPDQD